MNLILKSLKKKKKSQKIIKKSKTLEQKKMLFALVLQE